MYPLVDTFSKYLLILCDLLFFPVTFLTLSPLPACLHAFLLVVIHMVFGRWSDSRHFLYFSVSLDLPQYETVQFVPPPPEVGKPGSSDLMLHEAICQGLIVRFTLLEEVSPAPFVPVQSPNFPITPSL